MHIAERHDVSRASVVEVARGFPRLVRENVEENMVYLDMIQRRPPGLKPPGSGLPPKRVAKEAVEV